MCHLLGPVLGADTETHCMALSLCLHAYPSPEEDGWGELTFQ